MRNYGCRTAWVQVWLKLLPVMLGLGSHWLQAQEGLPVRMTFLSDTIEVARGATFTNILILKNTTAEPITVQSLTPAQKYPGMLLPPRAPVQLPAGEERRVPIKFLANTDFLKQAGSSLSFMLSYVHEQKTRQQTADFIIKKDDYAMIVLQPLIRELYADPAQPQISFSIIAENKGFGPRTIDLRLKTEPDGLTLLPQQQTVTLAAQEQKRLEFIINTPRLSLRYPEYRISVTATDRAKTEQVAYTDLLFAVLSASRQVNRTFSGLGGDDFAEVNYSGSNNGYDQLNIRANKALTLGNDWTGRVNVNADYYLTSGLYTLYDTWIEGAYRRSAVRLGNIQGNDYDYTVSGRGLKAGFGLTKTTELEAFAVENNYSLFGTYFPADPNSRLAGAKFSYGRDRNVSGKISYVYEDNARLATNSQVIHGTGRMALNKANQLEIGAGISSERGSVHEDQNFGITAAIHYEGKSGLWEWQSRNNYSSPTYAGFSRGSVSLNERISRSFGVNRRAFFSYDYSKTEPQYLSFQRLPVHDGTFSGYPRYLYGTKAAAAGYQFGGNTWNFSMATKLEDQQSENNGDLRSLLAYRIEGAATSSFGSNRLNLTAEYSYSRAGNLPDWFSSLRGMASYRFNNLSVSGTVQWNPLHVTEFSSQAAPALDFVNYYFYASYFLRSAHLPISGSVSAGMNYSQLYGTFNSNLNGSLEYKTKSNWAATAYVNFSGFRSLGDQGWSGNNYQYRIGLKKYFTPMTEKGNFKVVLQLFEDLNANGVLDAGEPLLSSRLVRLNHYVARSDRDGKVYFLNVPEGVYTLKISENEGAQVSETTVAVRTGVKRTIGVVKRTRVTGEVREIRQAYDLTESTAVGTNVYARDASGQVQYTVVDQQNNFEFLLKPGVYDIYIESDQFAYEAAKQTVSIGTPTTIPAPLVFRYRKKDTEVRIKRF